MTNISSFIVQYAIAHLYILNIYTARKAADDESNQPAGGSSPRKKIPKTDGDSPNEPGRLP